MQYAGLLVKYVGHVLIIDYISSESIMNYQVFSSKHSKNLKFVN